MLLIRVFVVNKQSCQYWYILGIQTSTLMHLILGMLIFMLGNGDVFIFFLSNMIYVHICLCEHALFRGSVQINALASFLDI